MTTSDTTDLPTWAQTYAQDCRDLFGLGDWPIVVKLVRAPNNDIENEGYSSVNVRYLTARIEIRSGMSDEDTRQTIMHEMLHVALAPIEQYHLRIRELVDEKLREHVDELQSDGTEQAIQRLTRALMRQIKPPKQETVTE